LTASVSGWGCGSRMRTLLFRTVRRGALALVLLAIGSASLWAAWNVADFRLQAADDLLVQAALGELHTVDDPSQRLHTAARWFLDQPYRLDPMGEACGSDTDPLYTWEQVDCITMLEVLLGFVYADTPQKARELTLKLRYDGDASQWNNRRHFTLAQWLPGAVELGLLHDITPQLAGTDVKTAKKKWSRTASCKGRWKTFCKRMGERFPETTVSFNYWPIKQAIDDYRRLPAGSMIFFLHTPRPSVPYQVFHAGVIGHDARGLPTLIHASKKAGKVLEVNAGAYLASLPERHKKWPVAAVLVYAPPAPGSLPQTPRVTN